MNEIYFYSETGNTEAIAHAISEAMPGAEVVALKDSPPDTAPQGGFCFLGTPVHGDDLPQRVRQFIEKCDPARTHIAVFYTHTGPVEDPSIVKFESNLAAALTGRGITPQSLWHCRCENKRADVVEWLRVNMPDRYRKAIEAEGLPLQSDLGAAKRWAASAFRSRY